MCSSILSLKVRIQSAYSERISNRASGGRLQEVSKENARPLPVPSSQAKLCLCNVDKYEARRENAKNCG